MQSLYFGIVENRNDPLELGRCQVRVVGLHTHDKSILPTADLPWCATMQATNSAAMNGIGHAPIGPVEGTSVVVTYLDGSKQQGLIMGAVSGVATEPLPIDFDDSGPIVTSESYTEQVELITVPGPTSGNKLTFFDPDTGRTDLTTKLEANMRVSGYGIEHGTTIISIDSGTEITISSTVRDLGQNYITVSPPLANRDAVIASQTNISSSSLQAEQRAEPIRTTPVNNEIPTLPPLPDFQDTQSKSSEGIKALIAACDKVGLETKVQKAAILGICGAESGWIPIEEAYNYRPNRLKAVFSFATDADVERYANAPSKGVSRHEFFSWVYGPSTRGANFLGNRTDDDGGRYYGRGLIQLTGLANYRRFQQLAIDEGYYVDLVNDPDILVRDINVSALIAALYIKHNVPSSVNANAHPAYFFAAKRAVGNNTPDIAARKLRYYEYFYGVSGTGDIVKQAGADQPNPSVEDVTYPQPSPKAISTGSFGTGFRDPNNKYPLQTFVGESDVNRLARGQGSNTIVDLKDATRRVGVEKSMGQGTWEQPPAPFSAKYPYNKVMETESGHIQEFDDTPGHERIHTYHRSGTFHEIDANGTQVNYIVGDNFVLMENNGCIHVSGECNLTVQGNTNVYCQTDANIQVAQNANLEVGNNLDIGVHNDFTMKVGGDYKLLVEGNVDIDALNLNAWVEDSVDMRVVGTYNVDANGSIDFYTEDALRMQSVTGHHVIDSTKVNIESSGTMDILSGDNMAISYAKGKWGMGAASADGAEVSTMKPLEDLVAPPEGTPKNVFLPYTSLPERSFEENSVIETPDDWDTPEGRAKLYQDLSTRGSTIPLREQTSNVTEEGGIVAGGTNDVVEVNTSIIETTSSFTNDFRLSRNFSLGMLIAGGVNGRHRLTPQMLKPNRNSPERLYTVTEIVSNLAETANNTLEKIISILPGGLEGYNKQWTITSGYRLRGVIRNESPSSDHCKGHCVDIALIGPDKNQRTFDLVQQIDKLIPYDQLILEYRAPSSCWIHIGYRKDNNRKMGFTMVNDSVLNRNANGIPYGFYLVENIPDVSN